MLLKYLIFIRDRYLMKTKLHQLRFSSEIYGLYNFINETYIRKFYPNKAGEKTNLKLALIKNKTGNHQIILYLFLLSNTF